MKHKKAIKNLNIAVSIVFNLYFIKYIFLKFYSLDVMFGMNKVKVSQKIEQELKELIGKHKLLVKIISEIDKSNGKALLVGGAVRDLLLQVPVKDLDIEVYGLQSEKLEEILKNFGPVSLVGKSFGVFRLHGLDIDFSIPRRDSAGRKPIVEVDPNMSYEDAFLRRDLTINAMGIDLVSYELIDPWGGQGHLKVGVLSAPDINKFTEDPLRFYRVMQFIGRFQMYPDTQLNDICRKMDISQVSIERIGTEFEKLILKSKRPSLGIRWLKDIGRLGEILPEVAAIIGVPQESKWHPEGDVFEHTMQCVDAAAGFDYSNVKNEVSYDYSFSENNYYKNDVIAKQEAAQKESEWQKLVVVYGALCHDLGKAIDTQIVDGKIKSIGHEVSGVKLTKKMISRITRNKELADSVAVLVRYHMTPCQLVDCNSKQSAYKRLAAKLTNNVTIEMLAKICLADKLGRNPKDNCPLEGHDESVDKFLQIAREAQVEQMAEKPILLGRDLLDEIEPGPKMGQILKKAYEIQIEEGIKDKQELKKLLEEDIKQARSKVG